MSERESSLKELFLSAKQHQDELETLNPQSHQFKDTIQAAIKALEDCRNLVSKLALYSSNEEIEDVATQDVQYLSIDYLLAELLLRSYGTDRHSQLKDASTHLQTFLARLDHYNLLSKADLKLYERYQENRKSFSIITTTNPEDRRNIKVSRYQEEKALKNQLKLLRDQSASNHVDDETIRSMYLAELKFFVHQTFQSLDMISQELSILAQIRQVEQPVLNGDDRSRGRTELGFSDRLDGPVTMGGLGRRGGPLLSPSGKPLQPFTLTDKRTQLRQGVFRPDHSLPTMSIDEYLEEEKKRGGIIEGGGNANGPQEELDEDNMNLVDAATMKAREWDEFVEANPKGAGNTLNRG